MVLSSVGPECVHSWLSTAIWVWECLWHWRQMCVNCGTYGSDSTWGVGTGRVGNKLWLLPTGKKGGHKSVKSAQGSSLSYSLRSCTVSWNSEILCLQMHPTHWKKTPKKQIFILGHILMLTWTYLKTAATIRGWWHLSPWSLFSEWVQAKIMVSFSICWTFLQTCLAVILTFPVNGSHLQAFGFIFKCTLFCTYCISQLYCG